MSASELFDVSGKRVIVTGGGSGIGTMIARGFVGAGASVIIASRKEPSLKEVTEELSQLGECGYIVADLSTEASADIGWELGADHENAQHGYSPVTPSMASRSMSA